MDAQFFQEQAIDGFNHRDGTVLFYMFVTAVYTKFPDGPRVLDFGAGRGSWAENTPSAYKHKLRDLREGATRVVAADVDEAVLENAVSDDQVVMKTGQPLPFEDGAFDVIVADYVMEHLAEPGPIMAELRRVLAPGGWLCFRTPNKWSYVAIAARWIPERLEGAVLKRSQPGRQERDIFPTVYALNSPSDFRRHMRGFDLHWFGFDGLPAYHMGSRLMYRLLRVLHWLLPPAMCMNWMVYARKR